MIEMTLLFALPFVFIFLTYWWMGGMPRFWRTMLWAFLLIVPSYYAFMGVEDYFEARGLCPSEVTDLKSAFSDALFVAAMPEEMAKLAAAMLLVLWAKRKKIELTARQMIICTCLTGCALAWYEGVGEVFIMGNDPVSRCIAYFGHYFYAVMMGYGLYSFVKVRNETVSGGLKTLRYAWSLPWMIVMPIAAHTFYDFMINALVLTDADAYFGYCVLGIIVFGVITYKIIKRISKENYEKNNIINALDGMCISGNVCC